VKGGKPHQGYPNHHVKEEVKMKKDQITIIYVAEIMRQNRGKGYI